MNQGWTSWMHGPRIESGPHRPEDLLRCRIEGVAELQELDVCKGEQQTSLKAIRCTE